MKQTVPIPTPRQYPPVVVVDEHDNEIGTAMLTEVWQRGLWHRIVAIFVLDDWGRMLLQLRGASMTVYPNHWDQAAGGHVDEGHSYEQAAAIELAEEIGLRDVELTTVATYRLNTQHDSYSINQFQRVYSVHVPHDVVLHPEVDEVSQLRWFTPTELNDFILEDPKRFTPGLLYDLQQYFPAFAPN